MYLREKLEELKILNIKIVELKKYIFSSNFVDNEIKNSIVKTILDCTDKIQTIKLILNRINNQTTIKIANTTLELSTAVIIRSIINNKICLITEMINNDINNLDILTLIEQRDELLIEFNTIDASIQLADWSVKLD